MSGQARRRIARKWIAAGAIAAAMAAMVIVPRIESAKKKEKVVLPEVVLRAQTVTVVILPYAKEPMADLFANRKAQEDVEKALMKWGRFQMMQEAFTADLVFGVRKGTGKVASPTISGGPVDTRPGTIETTDNQIRIGAQRGSPPNGTSSGDASGMGGTSGRASSGIETGGEEDELEVFIGGEQYRANSAPVWTSMAKDGLKAPAVISVEQFRKAVEDAEKVAAQKQKQQQGQKKNP